VTEVSALHAHLDPAAFVEAVRFTAATTGFDPRLVEKDYFCTLVLEQLSKIDTLVFKGGTCLAKVHAGFYRLSEDLDFAIGIPVDASRGARRSKVGEAKTVVHELEHRQPALRVAVPLSGVNASKQYLATVAYASLLTNRDETIKVEVALREPLLVQPVTAAAATLLLDPVAGDPLVEHISVTSIAFAEAFAEKFRAALTRREPAIRDFFDIDWAVRRGLLTPGDRSLVSLTASKLQVPGNATVDISGGRLTSLRRQLDLGLRPVLRPADFAAFDLDRAYTIVSTMAANIGAPR
jgi:predicted nucleotidyltransferase component of viral defense system